MPVMGPLVGRRSELQQISEAAEASAPGLVLAGAAGVGKTRLAQEAIAALDEQRFRAAQAVASSASRSIPFGALAHLLPSEGVPGQLNRLGWALEAIRGSGDDRRLVLSVDDAHLLDEASAAVVLQLARRGDAFVVATLRTEEQVPDAVRSLWKDGLLERLELAPLSREETAQMVDAVLGGRADAATAQRLWRVTDGNPLYLRELLLTGREAGTIVDHDGVFAWSGEVAMAPRLTELIDVRLGEVDEDESAALELVAFAEPIEMSMLAGLVPPSAIDAVEARKLVAVERDGDQQHVRLAHPLYGETIRARCPQLRARRRMRSLAEALEASGPRGRDDTLRLAVWRLETGSAHDPDLMLAACQIASAAGDMPLASRLGWAATNAGRGVDAPLLLSTILTFGQHFDEAIAVLATAEASAESDMDRARVAAARAFTISVGPGSVDAALRVLDDAGDGVREPVSQAMLATMKAEILTTAGQGREELATLEAIIEDPRVPLPVHVQSLSSAAFGYGHVGRLADAVACHDRKLALIDQWRDVMPHEVPRLGFMVHFAYALAGELDAAEAAVDALYRQGLEEWDWDFAIGALGVCRAQVSRLRGRIDEAQRRFREAALAVQAGGGHAFTPWCLGELAHVAALAGEGRPSREQLAEANRRRVPGLGMFSYWIDIAQTWVLACGGDVSGAIEHSLGTARRACDAGLVSFDVIASHDVVRLGAAERATDRLLAASHQAEGPFPAVCAEHATALAAEDSAHLLDVADRFAALGMMLHAAEAAAQAAGVLRSNDRAARSRTAEARAWALAQHCQGARTPALADLHAPGLTPSEREIAHLAAGDLTSREIADRLGKSVRTVDNHLASAYTKLGVHSRHELAGLLTHDARR